MINEKPILEKLDEAIYFYKCHMLNIEQTGYKYTLGYHNGRLDQLEVDRKLIKNQSAQEAATSKGTDNDINSLTQEQYNTGRKKSEIKELAVEILNLSLQLQENTDGRIVWRGKNKPCVNFRYYGATSGFSIKIWKKGFGIEQLPDYSTTLFLDDWNCINEAKQVKEILTKSLEESEKEQ